MLFDICAPDVNLRYIILKQQNKFCIMNFLIHETKKLRVSEILNCHTLKQTLQPGTVKIANKILLKTIILYL